MIAEVYGTQMSTTTATKTAPRLVTTGWRIPAALEEKFDRAWARLRAGGSREAKQAYAARVLEAGLTALRTKK